MNHQSVITAAMGLMLCTAVPSAAPAQSAGSYAYNFMKEVGCQLLPFSPCDVLDAESAINLLRTSQVMFMNRYCGTGSIETAKYYLENDLSLDPGRCRQILQGLGAIR
jgi:hypothetical protein